MFWEQMPENSLGSTMIEKLNFREVENDAHSAQSTVVEGASLIAMPVLSLKTLKRQFPSINTLCAL